MKNILLSIILFLCVCSPCLADYRPAVRIMSSHYPGRFFGSGTVIEDTGDKYIILTSAHLHPQEHVTVEFFDDFIRTKPIRAFTLFSRLDNQDPLVDVAILAVDKKEVDDKVETVELVDPSLDFSNMSISGMGFPNGHTLQYWSGRTIGQLSDGIYEMTHAPCEGESGGGIYIKDEAGKLKYVGLLTYRFGNWPDETGGFVGIHEISEIVTGTYKRYGRRSGKTGYRVTADSGDIICTRCQLPRKLHLGENEFCPKCNKHAMMYHEHLESSQHKSQISDCFPGIATATSPDSTVFNEFIRNRGHNAPQQTPNTSDDSKVLELLKKVDELNERLKEKGLELEGVKIANQGLQTRIETLSRLKDTLTNENSSLLVKIKEVKDIYEKAKSEHSTLREKLHADVQGLKSIIASIKDHPLDSITGGNGVWAERSGYGVLGVLLAVLFGPVVRKKFGNTVGNAVIWALEKAGKKFVEKRDKEEIITSPATKNEVEPLEEQKVVTRTSMNSDQSTYTQSQYALELMRTKQRQGTDIRKFAIYASLYPEAIEKLRAGLILTDNGPAPNHEKIARLIEDYVQDRLIGEMTKDTLRKPDYLAMMKGFLYQDAVSYLKKGEFNVLGSEEAAQAIERFVKNEFIRRQKV